jgi:hypothetical protein
MEWISIMNPFFLVFWLLPPTVLGLKYAGRIRVPVWALFIGYVAVGYFCVNLGIWFFYKSLGWLIHATVNPPEHWVEELAADGAKRVFGLLFGWLYAIVYFVVWLLPLWCIQKMIGLKRRSNQASGATSESAPSATFSSPQG